MNNRSVVDIPKLIAFYLPQFYPIPENDAWWGKGFTDWINVAKANPLFPGHYQPHIPADLGFYDLRLAETRIAQAEMAREYGIYGFCYYHYWFNGKQLLERPYEEVLASGQPDFPFCLCWANENWTHTWDGHEDNVLIAQNYSENDDKAHIKALIPAFLDKRYTRIDGKPLILIYRATLLPNPQKTLLTWRDQAKHAGLDDLYICRVESFPSERTDPRLLGFDAAVEFQPDWTLLNKPLRRGFLWRLATKLRLSSKSYQETEIFDYKYLMKKSLQKPSPAYVRIPCITPRWDNSPRRKKGALILRNSTPDLYKNWLINVIQNYTQEDRKEKFVFINAWNEWGEGNHLEPDIRFNRAYLEATQKALNTFI